MAEPDLDRLRKQFGTDATVLRVLSTCIEATKLDFARLESMRLPPSGDEMGEWLHHVLGGMSIVLGGHLTERGREVEFDLHQHGQSLQQIPDELLHEIREAFLAMVQLHDSIASGRASGS
jgi:hypothetical protein